MLYNGSTSEVSFLVYVKVYGILLFYKGKSNVMVVPLPGEEEI